MDSFVKENENEEDKERVNKSSDSPPEVSNFEVNENPMDMLNKRSGVPEVGMLFDSFSELFDYYNDYGAQHGFAVTKRTQKKVDGILRYATIVCSRSGESRIKAKNSLKPKPTTKTNCGAKLNAFLCPDGKWQLSKVVLEHNHAKSPCSRSFRQSRFINSSLKRQLEINDSAGIRMNKSFNALVVESRGPDGLTLLEKDCRNNVDIVRRLKLGEGDAAAIQKYFSQMQDTNPNFFYRMDLDEEGRLKNVFWADERSRAACDEFGDAITFDTTYLMNNYDMPLAPFVGVNHHGQLTLLGCGLISRRDIETFTWLFQAWLACMDGKAPGGIITDQDKAMQNAVEIVFPNSRHRWCLWHIMKKLPEKLKCNESYESISTALQHAVYETLTPNEFESKWNEMIEVFHLERNECLLGLYSERHHWVPCFVKDSFWAGMSTTQRSESMHAFFDGYVNSKTTLKQFVEQYENVLRNKVEKEKLEDSKSCNSSIRCISPYAMEKQIQVVYTIAKFQEFQEEMRGKMFCHVSSSQEHGAISDCDVSEDCDVGGRIKRMEFKVWLNKIDCEVKCNCCLFEFRGILCRHAISVLIHNAIYSIPDKYILRRWRKDIKRRHIKTKVSYDDWKFKPEGRRFENMCVAFNDVADIASDSNDNYNMVMKWILTIKGELERDEKV